MATKLCSYLGHPTKACTCAESELQRYRSRLTGALLDRIDLHLTLSPVPLRLLGSTDGAESSAIVRQRVEVARERQGNQYASQR
jgi:magnesium chelatase family protein